jgi:hypothetical protein
MGCDLPCAFLYHHTNTVLIVPENDVEKRVTMQSSSLFLALKRKKPQLTIKNGPFHLVVSQPETIPVLGRKWAHRESKVRKSGKG